MRVNMPVGFPYDEVSARTEHQEEKRNLFSLDNVYSHDERVNLL